MPDLPEPPTEPTLLLDELIARFTSATTTAQKGVLLRQLFLVLPEVPPNQPDWLEALDRVAVVPQESDIRLLMTTLQTAHPARFTRLSGSGQALAVTVTQSASALPIEVQALRTAFMRVHEQIGGDIANANGRLGQGFLHVPPDRVMVALFAMGPHDLAEAFGSAQLTAHKAWPFVVAALNTTPGTPRPYWFLVRRVTELGQLRAQLTRAASFGRPQLARRIHDEVLQGIDCLEKGRQLPTRHTLAVSCQAWIAGAASHSEKLAEAVERSKGDASKALTDAAAEAVREVATGFGTVAEAWSAIEQSGLTNATEAPRARVYWARKLAEASTEPNDITFLSAVVLDETLIGAHSAARQSLRMIDATKYGPSMALQA